MTSIRIIICPECDHEFSTRLNRWQCGICGKRELIKSTKN